MFLLRIYLLFPPPNLASIEFTSLTRDTNRFVCESTVFFLLLSDVRFKPFLPFLPTRDPEKASSSYRTSCERLSRSIRWKTRSIVAWKYRLSPPPPRLHSTREFFFRIEQVENETWLENGRRNAVMENYFNIETWRSNIETREEAFILYTWTV